MKKRITEAQSVGFLREADAGVAVKDLCRKHEFSEASYYTVAEHVRRHERLGRKAAEGTRDRNTRLKKLLADSLLENEVTREALHRKW
ncbi:MAG: transposase [Gemmatimonadaceae bacterium]